MQVSILYLAIVEWATKQGATQIDKLPGVWRGETKEYRVALNGQKEACEGIAVLGVKIEHKVNMRFAFLSPTDGSLEGVSESELIDHFKSQ